MLLDTLCLTGRVMWGRLGQAARETRPAGSDTATGQPEPGLRVVRSSARPIRSTPIALFQRPHAAAWLALAPESPEGQPHSTYAALVLQILEQKGASFFHDLVQATGLLASQVEQGLAELASQGLVSADSFAGLRALLVPSNRRKPFGTSTRRQRMAAVGIEQAGRWSLLRTSPDGSDDQAALEALGWTLLRRYGVVFRRLLERETLTVPWRRLAMMYRRLEARGEIRGGRFVHGMSGEQFALPEAVGKLRAIRRLAPAGQLVSVSAADPLNLVGIITPGEKVPAQRRNRIVFEDGVPLAALESGMVRQLAEYPGERRLEIERALIRRTPVRAPGESAASG